MEKEIRRESVFPEGKTEEITGILKTSVLDSLEETMGVLANAWKDDEAANVFLTNLSIHHENIRAALRQLESAAQYLTDKK